MYCGGSNLGDVDALRGATGDRVFHLSRHVRPRGMTRIRRGFSRNLNRPCKPWTNEAIAGRRCTLLYWGLLLTYSAFEIAWSGLLEEVLGVGLSQAIRPRTMRNLIPQQSWGEAGRQSLLRAV